VVYSRAACHLCDEMIVALRDRGLTAEVVDVDSDPELVRRFGLRVPVLVADDEEVCHYHLDAVRLDRLLMSQ
jgi:hypothetical protein